MTKTRHVIVHYHIYKNSGTSFDHVLAHSFGDRHQLFDGPFPFFTIGQDELDTIIQRQPRTLAFSSHQIALPQPTSLTYRPLAAVFLRNPLLRIGSIYRFKRQSDDGTSTSDAARRMDFAEWIAHCFASPREIVHISNAQTRMLSQPYGRRPLRQRSPEGMEYDLDMARRNLSNVELLGRTEQFEDDVRRFSDLLAPFGLTLRLPDDLRKNVTQDADLPVDERVGRLLDQLDPALRQQLISANAQDLALYDHACRLIAANLPV